MPQKAQLQPIAPLLLPWFAQNRRVLPFREDPTPYHIWVSEIMLQQTRMSAAVPYYLRFMQRLPTVRHLAECDPDTLQKLWEGLGYYSRVRNMQKAAQLICRQYGGQLPADLALLKTLPGVGAYTAGAIASIGFGIPAPAVDGNVLRVFSRLWRDETDISLPAAKTMGEARVMEHQPPENPGDFNQALMELGALVCVPGRPACEKCPLTSICQSYGTPDAERLPVKAPRPPKKSEHITIALVHSPKGWLLCRRPAKGLLAGLWQPALWPQALTQAQLREELVRLLPGCGLEEGAALKPAVHKFTHVEWQMQSYVYRVQAHQPPEGYVWADEQALRENYALPGAFKHCLKAMLPPDKNN